jgi:GntR family uxuAB operon transcriptional repressor
MTTRHYQVVGKELIAMISNGKYEVGDKLPSERDISISMDVSRAIVREAMIMLELYGYVQVKKGSGVYITAIPNLQEKYSDEGDSDIGPFELLQARQIIESNIAYVAAKSITKSDVLAIKSILERERELISKLDKQEDEAKTLKHDSNDRDFHLALANATHNSIFVEIINLFWEKRLKSRMWQQLQSRISSNEYKKAWLGHHEAILHALITRDADLAHDEMYNHIQEVASTLFKLSDVENPDFDGYFFDFDLLENKKKSTK